MTQASAARSNKKKPHATRSFDQMVSETTLARLRPFIQQQVSQASQQLAQNVYQAMMGEKAMMQTRQLAFERLLKQNVPWFNDDVLAMAVADVEDESSGQTAVDDGAQTGDKVRVEFIAKYGDKGDWSPVNKLAIHSLGSKGPGGTVQTGNDDFETGIVGMKPGETREFLLPEPADENNEPENTRIQVTVKRVSRTPKAEAVTNG